jgi:hypothetical protein
MIHSKDCLINDDEADDYDLYEKSPKTMAIKVASEKFGVDIDDKTLNLILRRYVLTSYSLEHCVETTLQNEGLI